MRELSRWRNGAINLQRRSPLQRAGQVSKTATSSASAPPGNVGKAPPQPATTLRPTAANKLPSPPATLLQTEKKSPAKKLDDKAYAGFVAVAEEVLLVTANSQAYAAASPRLLAYDRRSGKLLWQRRAAYSFRHNAICAGGGRVFLIDCLSQADLERSHRYGKDLEKQPEYQPRLLCLDMRTGGKFDGQKRRVRHIPQLFPGAQCAVAGRKSRTRSGRRRGSRGNGRLRRPRWPAAMAAPRSRLRRSVPAASRYDYYPGRGFFAAQRRPKLHSDPLTGQEIPWAYRRNYGCSSAIGSEHLLTFRSAAAGFYDLAGDSGTGNLGGFKSGCTSNLIVADGVLSAPEYTRTCTCRYQNQTSLALVHDPQVELWTFNSLHWDGHRVRRVGINLGAPGDRGADDGTLWLDYPSVGGPSPDIPVTVRGAAPAHRRRPLAPRPDSPASLAQNTSREETMRDPAAKRPSLPHGNRRYATSVITAARFACRRRAGD